MSRIKSWARGFNFWNEVASIPLGVLLFIFSPVITIWLDKQLSSLIKFIYPNLQSLPAIWGPEMIQKQIFAFSSVAIANGIAWVGLKVILSTILNYKNGEAEEAFTRLTDYQKWIILSTWFCFYFLGYILALQAL